MSGTAKTIADAADPLTKPRASVSRAITDLQAFEGTAGSAEMRAVTQAIDWLGMVFSILSPSTDNPAWSDE